MKQNLGKLDLSIIIPAYNEESKIEQDIREAFDFLNKNKLRGEVIVSTDGVSDRTNLIVRSLQKSFKSLRLIARKKRVGKGGAIRSGVKVAVGQIIMFADAGSCVLFNCALKGMRLLNKSDIAIGSRELNLSKVILRQPLYRRIGSKLFSLMIHSALGIPDQIKDTQCGFKLFKNRVAKELFNSSVVNKFMIDIEILLLAKKRGYRVVSFPVIWTNDPDTKFDPLFGSIDNIVELFKIKVLRKL